MKWFKVEALSIEDDGIITVVNIQSIVGVPEIG